LGEKQLFLSIFVILVIVFSVFSSLPYSVNIYANEGRSTSIFQAIIPFFMNPSPGNTTAIKSSSSSQSVPTPINESITSSSSIVNTTGWNSVNTTLGIQFLAPPDWIADQFESPGVEGRTTTEPTTRGVNFTSPESNNTFFMVNVTDNNNNNNQTTLSEIADSITRSTQNITKENTTTLSGLPAYEIISLREIQASLLNITDLITTGNDKLYHIQYGAEANDIASFSTFKDVLGTFKIDSAKSPSLNDTRTNQTQAQNLTSTPEEQQQREQEEIEDMRSPPPVPLESPEQRQSPPQSLVPSPMQQQQYPYSQVQPSVPIAPQYQHPYSQAPILSSPYSSYNQLPQFQYPIPPFQPPSGGVPSMECPELNGRCFRGWVTQVTDGDTLKISNEDWRLALTSTPELNEPNGPEAKAFTESQCPPGIEVLVDQDDGQLTGIFDREVGAIYCGVNAIQAKISLNEILLQRGFAIVDTRYCDESEFALTTWAQQYGCS
jgi:endonuclease YncB( thermonuclease family)